MLGALVHARVAGIAKRDRLLAVQKQVCNVHISRVGRRGDQGVRESGVGIHTDVRLHPFFVWCISGSRLPSLFLVDEGAAMIVAEVASKDPRKLSKDYYILERFKD